jgi:hypothetical protein
MKTKFIIILLMLCIFTSAQEQYPVITLYPGVLTCDN